MSARRARLEEASRAVRQQHDLVVREGLERAHDDERRREEMRRETPMGYRRSAREVLRLRGAAGHVDHLVRDIAGCIEGAALCGARPDVYWTFWLLGGSICQSCAQFAKVDARVARRVAKRQSQADASLARRVAKRQSQADASLDDEASAFCAVEGA